MGSESHKLLQKDSAGDLSRSSHSAMGLSCCLSRPRFSEPQHLAMLFLVSCRISWAATRAELAAAVPVPAVLCWWLQMWPLWLSYSGCCCRDLRSLLFPSQGLWLRSCLRVQSRSC